jgi:glycosyltransferase involved in cell wall biosynthesis
VGLKIVCSGHLVRHPVGGHSWHHLQYLVGFRRLGHDVTFFEDWGWPNSCYDPARNIKTDDPAYGLQYLRNLLRPFGLEEQWCYLAGDGRAYGMPRERLAELCRECDVYFNLSNINWIPELYRCRRRVLVDTDPVFTQIGAQGLGGPFARYHALFTYGENVHLPGCDMPTGRACWLPTRQPVVLDLWPVAPGDPSAPFTTVMNWAAYGARQHNGRVYGQKDREFEPFITLPRDTGLRMELAVNAPEPVRKRLADGGWRLADPLDVSRDPWTYQAYLGASAAEFCVAKHGYVSTGCGWFSDRSSAYMAMGRPVVVQDTGFSDFLPCGAGLLAYRRPSEAVAAIRRVHDDYDAHCRAARALVEEHFDASRVLTSLLERSL